MAVKEHDTPSGADARGPGPVADRDAAAVAAGSEGPAVAAIPATPAVAASPASPAGSAGSAGSADAAVAATPATPASPAGSTGPPNDPSRPQTEAHALAPKVASFPHLPGVYLFKAEDGAVLYAGKAIDLRKRISNYFRAGDALTPKTRMLLAKTADLEFVVTPTEKEALLLEASLIKKHRPRYNVVLRDDKNYPAIRIDPREPYPRIEIVRRFQRDGALYFGPYHSAYAVRDTVKHLYKLFPLRLCKGKKLLPRDRPCLNYSMGRCLGACAGKISQEDYRKMAGEVILFLQGKGDALQQQLRKRMEEASGTLDFEKAAFYRDRLRNIAVTLEKQHVVSNIYVDQDVIGLYQDDAGTELAVLSIRQGVVAGQRTFDLKEAHGEPHELIEAFIQQYYGEGKFIPDEVVTPVAIELGGVIEDWLAGIKGKRVRVWPAKRGERKHLLDMAGTNAHERFVSRRRLQRRDRAILESLQRLLKLPRVPVRIACVDISNIQGLHAVGAVVVFEDTRPDKNSYRRYRIRIKSEPDDPAMMAEAVERLIEGDRELAAGLDLLLLDGGRGQLGRIVRLLSDLGQTGLFPVAAIAKEREADVGEKGKGSYEKIYLPGRKNPLFLHRYPDILHLLQRIRDEAHRFAITHYQSVHRTALLTSALDAIPGVGPKRRRALLQHFGGIEQLQEASAEEIEAAGVPAAVAEKVLGVLNGMREDATAKRADTLRGLPTKSKSAGE